MKLVCAQNSLNSNLSLVSRAVSSRPTHPVLANVLLIADEETQQINLSAFDLSLGIQTSFPAEVEEGGKLTLPAKLLSDIVSRLPDSDIALDSSSTENDAGYLITLTSASGRYQVRGMGTEEFPELPVVGEGNTVHLPVEALIEGLKGALFAASADETKQVLTGVHLTIQAEGLEFAATDGHRLSVVQTVNEVPEVVEKSTKSSKSAKAAKDLEPKEPEPQEPAAADLSVTIPAKALQELSKMLERQGDRTVSVHFDQSQAVFEWTDQRLTSRLLEGQYPNYRQLVPRQFARQVTVERRLLLTALERIAVLADQKNNIVKMSLSGADQAMTLSVDAQDVGSARETIPAQVSGEDLDIAFNVKYLMDGLKALNTAEVQIQLNTATSPVIVTPLGELKMTYLVMPVQIRG